MTKPLPTHGRCRRAITLALAIGSLLAFGPFAGTAGAAFTSTLDDTTATITADGIGLDFLLLQARPTGDLLRHNRFFQGDGCFESNTDWDCVAGIQTLANEEGSVVDVVGSAGLDDFEVESGTAEAPEILAELNFDGGPGPDHVFSVALGDAADEVTLEGGRIEGATAQPIDYLELSDFVLLTRGGDDTVRVATPPASSTEVFAGAGDDTLELADGADLGTGFEGRTGTDTLDYSDWSTPVAVELGVVGQFFASMRGAKVVPPNGSDLFGFASLSFDLDTGAFDYQLSMGPIAQADVTDSHIHSAPAGANGPEVFEIGPGAAYQVSEQGLRKVEQGVIDPDVADAALRSGSLYFNVETTAFGDGEIRGQLEPDEEAPYVGRATGTDGVGGIEAVIGGDGDDVLKGTPLANRIEGGDGADTIEAGPGDDVVLGGSADDVLLGEEGADRLLGGEGDDTVEAADGIADLAIECGAGGADFAHRDPAAIDPDAIVSGCETVDPPLTAVPDPDPEGENPDPEGEGPPLGGGGNPPSGGGPKPLDPPRPVGLLSPARPKTSGHGARVTLDTRSRATCPADATGSCTLKVSATAVFPAATLAANARRATLAKATRSLAPGASAPAVLKLSAGKSAAWREAGRLRVSFVVSLAVPGGDALEQRGSPSLLPPRAK